MIGIFDSGAGGLAALGELRRLCPAEDVLFLADRKNAPYGTRTEDEILYLTEKNISKLLSAGAQRVLIACCTASTVHDKLPEEPRRLSVPIIEPTAMRAKEASKNGSVAVIATKHTAESGAFSKAVYSIKGGTRVEEYPAQELVEIAERTALGHKLGKFEISVIERVLTPVLCSGADTLILGCTHFSHLKDKIQSIAKNINIIDSALVGAEVVAECAGMGVGATVFLQT